MSGLLRELLRRVMDDNEPEVEVDGSDTEPLVGGDSEDEEQFDIALPASHSYMGGGRVLGGRALLAGGWRGRVPVLAAGGALFPGEVVPLLLPHPHDARALRRALDKDKLFGLLATDEGGARATRYGTLCEVFEAGEEAGGGGPLSLKARAIHRFRLAGGADPAPIHVYSRVREEMIEVLAEPRRGDPLRPTRLASLDALRRDDHTLPLQRRLRALDAAGMPWPLWVYDMFTCERLRRDLAPHFRALNLEDKMPADEVSLSFWASSNMALSARTRLELLRAPCARARLRLCARAAAAARSPPPLCCTACRAPVARGDHVFAMSSDGVHSNYTNLGGFLHDVVTVSECHGVALSGAPSAEYSWFPGYSWTIALCAACSSHVGWRFKALRRNLRPQQFYGLSRSYVEPAEGPPGDLGDPDGPP